MSSDTIQNAVLDLIANAAPFEGSGEPPRDGHARGRANGPYPSIPAGTIVRAGDRANFGTVVSDNGQTCAVHFVSPEGQEATKELPRSMLRRQDGSPLGAEAVADVGPPVPLRQLVATHRHLRPAVVEGLLRTGETLNLIAAPKQGKSWLAITLALAVATGRSWLEHASKGDQSGKGATDVGSGAGSQSRAADTHLIIRPHESEGVAVVDAVTRSWPPVERFAIRWKFPVWRLAEDADPQRLQQPGSARKKEDAAAAERAVIEALEGLPKGEGVFPGRLRAMTGLSPRRVERVLHKLAKAGVVTPCSAPRSPTHRMPQPGAFRLASDHYAD